MFSLTPNKIRKLSENKQLLVTTSLGKHSSKSIKIKDAKTLKYFEIGHKLINLIKMKLL